MFPACVGGGGKEGSSSAYFIVLTHILVLRVDGMSQKWAIKGFVNSLVTSESTTCSLEIEIAVGFVGFYPPKVRPFSQKCSCLWKTDTP